MAVEILTRQDLDDFKIDLIKEIKSAVGQSATGKKEALYLIQK
jgi:hypothetical protein